MDRLVFSNEDIVSYFKGLPASFEGFEHFAQMWDCVSQLEGGQDLADVLEGTVTILGRNRFSIAPLDLDACKDYIHAHFDLWRDVAHEGLGNLDAPNLARISWSLGKLQIYPDKKFMDGLAAASTRAMSNFSLEELNMSLTGFCELAAQPDEAYWEAWLKAYESHAPLEDENFDVAESATTVRLFAIQDALRTPYDLTPSAHKILNLLNQYRISENSILQRILDASMRFDHEYLHDYPRSGDKESRAERIFSYALKEARINFKSHPKTIFSEDAPADFELFSRKKIPIYLELDGIYHSVYNHEEDTFHYNGSWHLKSSNRARYSEAVYIHLPHSFTNTFFKRYTSGEYHEQNAAIEGFSKVLRRLYNEALDFPAGIYVVPHDYADEEHVAHHTWKPAVPPEHGL